MREQIGKVLLNEKVAKDMYLLELSLEEPFLDIRPGQFLMVKIGTDLDPLLRRPFSVYKISNKNLWILYKVVGRGTLLMTGLSKGTEVPLMGPLGNGFEINAQHLPVLVAGGIGIAGMGGLAQSLTKKIYVAGFRTREEIPLSLLEGDDVILTCEEGSLGIKGTVIDGLREAFRTRNVERPYVYACGSIGMLKAVYEFCKSLTIPCQVLIESRMACGVGACQGCVIPTDSGYKRVCKEGPVFKVDEILWDKL